MRVIILGHCFTTCLHLLKQKLWNVLPYTLQLWMLGCLGGGARLHVCMFSECIRGTFPVSTLFYGTLILDCIMNILIWTWVDLSYLYAFKIYIVQCMISEFIRGTFPDARLF